MTTILAPRPAAKQISVVRSALHFQVGDRIILIGKAPIDVASVVSRDVQNVREGKTVLIDSEGKSHSFRNASLFSILRQVG